MDQEGTHPTTPPVQVDTLHTAATVITLDQRQVSVWGLLDSLILDFIH